MKKTQMRRNNTLRTHNFDELSGSHNNIYATTAAIGVRSRQLGVLFKKELYEKLEEFKSPLDNLEDVFENKEQIEISRAYEKRPKPVLMAAEEFIKGQLIIDYK